MANDRQEKFAPGALVMTATARDEAIRCGVNLVPLLQRHLRGDWGEVDDHDRRENERALQVGERLLSVYTEHGITFWIITEWDRSATTVLLPTDY